MKPKGRGPVRKLEKKLSALATDLELYWHNTLIELIEYHLRRNEA